MKETIHFSSFSWIISLLHKACSGIPEKTPSIPHCRFPTVTCKSHTVLQTDTSSHILPWRRIFFCSSPWETKNINSPLARTGAMGRMGEMCFHSPLVFAFLTGISHEEPNSSQPAWVGMMTSGHPGASLDWSTIPSMSWSTVISWLSCVTFSTQN